MHVKCYLSATVQHLTQSSHTSFLKSTSPWSNTHNFSLGARLPNRQTSQSCQTHIRNKNFKHRGPLGLCAEPPIILFRHDCVASQNNTSIIKFADDTAVIGLIINRNETPYRMSSLRRLRKFGMLAKNLSNSYRSTTKHVLTSSITMWYEHYTAQDRKALQRVIRTTQSISGAAILPLQYIYHTRVIRKALSISIRENTDLQHSLFTLLPSG